MTIELPCIGSTRNQEEREMVYSRRQSEVDANDFQDRLRRLVRIYRPIDFSLMASQIIHSAIHDLRQQARYPIHFLLHAIEANCAYQDRHTRIEELTRQRFDAIITFYHDYRDPYIRYVLEVERNLGSWVLAMARQQFIYQQYYDHTYTLARAMLLFIQDQPMPRIQQRFQERYGMTMFDWVSICFGFVAMTNAPHSPLVGPGKYLSVVSETLPESAFTTFLEMASRSPGDIASRYREDLNASASHLRIFRLSIFLDYPLISLHDRHYLSPHPGLLYRFCLDGLYRYCQGLDGVIFADEFGRSFERYVRRIMEELGTECQIFHEPRVPSKAEDEDQACDYAVVYKDAILLVECKAVRYSARFLTDNAIEGDNSTSKLAKSLEQISETASRIRSGDLDQLFNTRNKRLIGISVTFGHIYFANSPNYVRQYILPKANRIDPDQWPSPLDYDSQILSIDVFERFIAVLRSTGLSPAELLKRKLAKESSAVGDWDNFLHDEFESQNVNWHLDLIAGVTDALIARFD